MSNPTKDTISQLKTNPQPPKSTFTLVQTSTSLSAISNIDTSSSNESELTLLIHATNTFGTWGAGFTLALQTLYPAASSVYESLCDERRPSPSEWPSRELVGRCLVVPPQDGDGNIGVWIGCLFTSYGYGGRDVRGGKGGGHARKDGVGMVKQSTMKALRELRGWVRQVEEGGLMDDEVGGDGGEMIAGDSNSQKKERPKVIIYSPKFNSGNFGVDWQVTADMIREVFGNWEGEWRILADR